MTKLEMIGGVVELVVTVGVTTIVSNGIKVITPVRMSTFRKVSVAVGGFVLSNMVADAACNYVEKKMIDPAISFMEELVKEKPKE